MKTVYVFGRLWSYAARYKLKLLVIILIGLVAVSFEVLKPLPIKLVIDNVFSNRPLPSLFDGFHLSSLSRERLLGICIVLMLAITICSALLSIVVSNLTINLAQQLVFDISVDFYSKLQNLSLTFYSRNRVGDLLQRMSGDVYVVYFLVAQIIIPVITSVICLSAMFYIMVKIDLVLALIAFSVVPLLGLTLAFFAKPLNDTTTQQYTSQGNLSAFVQQSLSSMRIIQAFGREKFMYQKLEKHAFTFGRSFQIATKVSMTYGQICLLITGLSSAVVVGVGAYRGMNGSLSAGDLFIFLGYIAALYGPVNSLTTAIGAGISIGARGRRIFEVLDSDEVVKEKPGALDVASNGEVEFRNVSFGYETNKKEGRTILHNISFHVPPGQIVALVGATGSGKTSMISLLCRFYDPGQGEILLDGVNIKDLKLHALRENISLVLQDPFLFPMTIAENIAFGNPDSSLEEIIQAAQAAQADEFIKKMPQGYDTVISENGSSLSGGEKQRIAIARAFLKKAPILILDEPTSAVDALTEAKIFSALSAYSKGKTVFLISHRLSTLKHADQIVAIKEGHIVEQGTHENLLRNENVYAGLYKYQHIT
jgi:ATP-binding cassette subfamily B protein